MSKVSFEDIFPLYKIEGKALVNKYGDVTCCFKYRGKEMFSQDRTQLEATNEYLNASLNFLDGPYVIHKQDISLRSQYKAGEPEYPTYLSKSYQKHFDKKEYYKTYSYLFVTKTSVLSVNRDYSTVRKPGSSGKWVVSDLDGFENTVEQWVAYLRRGGIELVPFTHEETEKVLEGYFSLYEEGLLRDITFEPDFRVGDNRICVFSLNNDENQPDAVAPYGVNSDFSTEGNSVYSDFLYNLGFGLKTDHVVNQIFFIDGQRYWLDNLEKKGTDLKSMTAFSTGNGKKYADNKKFLDDTVNADGTKRVMRMHMNVIFWAESDEKLRGLQGMVKGKFVDLGIRAHQANKYDLRSVFLSSCPGNAGTMPFEESFITHSDLALSYLIKESVIDRSHGKPSKNDLVFADRASNIPAYRDCWYGPYEEKKISNRNVLVVGESGGGKSSTVIEILRQRLENNFDITGIDIGRSAEVFTKLYGGNYIIYEDGMSLGINPFQIEDKTMTVSHLEFLASFINVLWKPTQTFNEDQLSALEKVIVHYYQAKKEGKDYRIDIDGKSSDITKFYSFVDANKDLVRDIARGREDFFSIDSFLLSMEKFVDGKFDTLFKRDNMVFVDPTKPLTFFELDNIKDHPTLFAIFAMLITHMSTEVLWKKRNSYKLFWFDEYWKVKEKPGIGPLSYYLTKTVRKFDGGVGFNIQTIGDLKDPFGGNLEETILGNTAIKLIMKHKPELVPALAEKLGWKMDGHEVALLKSINNDLSGKFPYVEHLNMVGNDVRVVRNMVSPQQRVNFMSEFKEKEILFKLVETEGSMEKGIEKFIKQKGWV